MSENQAIEYHKRALAIARKTRDRRIKGETLCNFGKAYAALEEIKKAIGYYEQSLEIVRKSEYRRGEGNALFDKGLALDKLSHRK